MHAAVTRALWSAGRWRRLESARRDGWQPRTRGDVPLPLVCTRLGADAPVASARRGVAATGSVMGSGRLACAGGAENLWELDVQLQLTQLRDWLVIPPLPNSPSVDTEHTRERGVRVQIKCSFRFGLGHERSLDD